MKNKHYEFVSGSIFGVVAALQAIRAIFQIPAQVGTHDVPLWISWVAVALPAVSAFGPFKRPAMVRTKH